MATALSQDLRVRAVAAYRNGESCRSVGARFAIAPSTVVKWAGRQAETGSLKPGKMGGHRPFLLAPHRAFILTCIEATPHLTLSRLRELLAERGVDVCRDTVWRFLKAEGLSFKKNASGQ